MKRLDTIANVCVIVTAIVFLAFIGHRVYQNHFAPSPQVQNLVGRTVDLRGVQFSANQKTLLIAISTTCHFCQESEPFYRQLASRTGSGVALVAVLPQPIAAARDYVSQSIAPSVPVVSQSLDSIGVNGTPTLLLVDSKGTVKRAWVGKLGDEQQAEVQKALL